MLRIMNCILTFAQNKKGHIKVGHVLSRSPQRMLSVKNFILHTPNTVLIRKYYVKEPAFFQPYYYLFS